MSAEIDVIIPSRDRPPRLAACLAGLRRQTFSRFRVIVVDDGSCVPVADSLSTELEGPVSLRIVRNESATGPAASRNRGVAAGDAPFVLFLDDDVVPLPELLARHRSALVGEGGRVVSIGALLPSARARLPPWDAWQADRVAREHARLGRGEAVPSWRHVYTGNVALRRSDFAAVGGFDPAFARQEDMELGFRLARRGCRFVFEPAAAVWHESEHSLEEWLRIPAANARYDVLMDRLRPDSGRLVWVRADLGRRHPLLRVGRRALRRPRFRGVAIGLATAAGFLLHRCGAHRASLPVFSLVWDLEYDRGLTEATAGDAGAAS